MHRLLAVLKVDDGKTGVSEADGTVLGYPGAGGVGAAVVQGGEGGGELGLETLGGVLEGDVILSRGRRR